MKKMHREEKTVACNPPFRSPKQEEEEVPVIKPNVNDNTIDELEGFWGIQGDDKFGGGGPILTSNWDFMNWDEFSNVRLKEEESDDVDHHDHDKIPKMERDNYKDSSIAVKKESIGCFWDEEKTISLNLNYQEVLDAWSDGRSPWADGYSLSTTNEGFMGEVPVMEEEKMRREARVLRYKEKRHSRLFSKKIRYQVRKLNAEKRPRLKGRFVKRVADKTMR